MGNKFTRKLKLGEPKDNKEKDGGASSTAAASSSEGGAKAPVADAGKAAITIKEPEVGKVEAGDEDAKVVNSDSKPTDAPAETAPVAENKPEEPKQEHPQVTIKIDEVGPNDPDADPESVKKAKEEEEKAKQKELEETEVFCFKHT